MAGNLTIGALLTLGTDRLRGPRTPVANAAPRAVAAEALTNRDTAAPRAANATRTLDAELLLAHALSKTRTHLKTHPEAIPPPEQARRYADLIGRRAAGEPIAYILGYRDFWTLPLSVNPSHLGPRPETQLLTDPPPPFRPPPPPPAADLPTASRPT